MSSKKSKRLKNVKQLSFEKNSSFYQFNHGGTLRKKRIGRKQRPLSTKEPLHVVFKVDKSKLRSKTLRSSKSYKLIQKIIKTYAKHFYVQLEQISIQNDHCRLLVRTKRRSSFIDQAA
ncbi:MAG: transposase [Bdellovibrio sp.]|nr:transposase [Bdellovibrio sp.]